MAAFMCCAAERAAAAWAAGCWAWRSSATAAASAARFAISAAVSKVVSPALRQWENASHSQQQAWADAYQTALGQAPDTFAGNSYAVPGGGYGPLGAILRTQYQLAVRGGLDNALRQNPNKQVWFNDDYTLAELYLGDSGNGGFGNVVKFGRQADAACLVPGQKPAPGQGCWYYNQAVTNTAPNYAGYLAGDTWGITNEVGNFPGAWWLVPYTVWYQFGWGLSATFADLWAMIATGLVSLPFLFLPWIPGLRDIPKLTRVYRLMWGDYYKLVEQEKAAGWGKNAT